MNDEGYIQCSVENCDIEAVHACSNCLNKYYCFHHLPSDKHPCAPNTAAITRIILEASNAAILNPVAKKTANINLLPSSSSSLSSSSLQATQTGKFFKDKIGIKKDAMKPKKTMTIRERLALIKKVEAEPKISQKNLAKWAAREFNLENIPSQATISKILKKKENLINMPEEMSDAKTMHAPQCMKLDTALANWVMQMNKRKIPISGDIIMKKGELLGDLISKYDPSARIVKFSNGWLDGFKKRHGFKDFGFHGEKSFSGDSSAIYKALPELIELSGKFPLCNIYNMDEIGLLYRIPPSTAIAQKQLEGKKRGKQRLTVVLSMNYDGSDRLEPMIIGNYRNPRCFGGHDPQALGLNYEHSENALMNKGLFQKWIQCVDSSMKSRGKNILVLMDDAPSHVLDNITTTNVVVKLFSPNIASKIMALHSGIVREFKKQYRCKQLEFALDRGDIGNFDVFKISQLAAMRWVRDTWSSLSSDVIRRCWEDTVIFNQCVQFPVSNQCCGSEDAGAASATSVDESPFSAVPISSVSVSPLLAGTDTIVAPPSPLGVAAVGSSFDGTVAAPFSPLAERVGPDFVVSPTAATSAPDCIGGGSTVDTAFASATAGVTVPGSPLGAPVTSGAITIPLTHFVVDGGGGGVSTFSAASLMSGGAFDPAGATDNVEKNGESDYGAIDRYLLYLIESLHLPDPMNIDELMNVDEEDVHLGMDRDIPRVPSGVKHYDQFQNQPSIHHQQLQHDVSNCGYVGNSSFAHAGDTNGGGGDGDDDDDDEYNIPHPQMAIDDVLHTISKVIYILNDYGGKEHVIKELRQIQSDYRLKFSLSQMGFDKPI